MRRHLGVTGESDFGLSRVQEAVSVEAMHDIAMMAQVD
jgi:hypothetical protein